MYGLLPTSLLPSFCGLIRCRHHSATPTTIVPPRPIRDALISTIRNARPSRSSRRRGRNRWRSNRNDRGGAGGGDVVDQAHGDRLGTRGGGGGSGKGGIICGGRIGHLLLYGRIVTVLVC
jgi:hypothetical protein